jgi:hypothetical protein
MPEQSVAPTGTVPADQARLLSAVAEAAVIPGDQETFSRRSVPVESAYSCSSVLASMPPMREYKYYLYIARWARILSIRVAR